MSEPIEFPDGPDVVERAMNGEVFEDDGFRLEPLIRDYLKSLNGHPYVRSAGFYSPSSLNRCSKALWYQRTGVPGTENLDPTTRMIFGTGKAVHTQLNEYVCAMFGLQEAAVEQLLAYEDLHIKGEADLLIYKTDGSGRVSRVIDFKTVNTKRFSRLRCPEVDSKGLVTPPEMEGYVWQLHAYMAAVRHAVNGTLFYYNKDDSQMLEFSFPFSFPVWSRIDAKLTDIECHIRAGTVPDREIDKWRCPDCAWYDKCLPPGVKKRRDS